MSPIPNRRGFLQGAGWLAAAGVLGGGVLRGPTRLEAAALPAGARTHVLRFAAEERPGTLPCFSGHRLPMWTFAPNAWPPVIRVDLGDSLDVTLDNRLPRDGEHTSIHWHGIRLPNAEDGVPYLVQPPVERGASHRYRFTPPDTGTFFFHSHCNTAEQLGRGLVGILIVDGDAPEPYAADEIILLKDWLVDPDAGTFRDFYTPRGAHRAGTYGNVRSANGLSEAVVALPAAADCRLRIINGDPTRVMEIAVDGAEAAVIAVDGVAVPPFPLTSWSLGPAMRLDVVVRAPGPMAEAVLVDLGGNEPARLARLVGTGPAAENGAFDPRPLRAGRIPSPRFAEAERRVFRFGTADGARTVQADDPTGLALGSICGSAEAFWTINGASWPGRDHSTIPPPIAVLERGRSYAFSLKNDSRLTHPIHIHGHTFLVTGSDQRALPPHHADTTLLRPGETVEVAFVADNPGDWMFHCHVIEHQEAGMMSYIRVA